MNRFFSLLLCFCPVSASALITFEVEDANANLFNNTFPIQHGFAERAMPISVGDFNGDGLDDVAFVIKSNLTTDSETITIKLFFAPFEKGSVFLTNSQCTLALDRPGYLNLPSVKMADLNGDGRDDLAIFLNYDGSDVHQIRIVFGEKDPPFTKDLGQVSSDLKIMGPPGSMFGQILAAGDFNGDGVDDYAMLSSGETSLVYFLLGGSSLPSGTVDLSSINPFVRLVVNGHVDDNLVIGNFNEDQSDDIAFGIFRTYGDSTFEEVSVFMGRSPFPAAGGADLTTDVQIVGRYAGLGGRPEYDIKPVSAGDMTGDHRDELVISGFSSLRPRWIVNGSDVSSGRPTLRQQSGFPESVIFYPILNESNHSFNGLTSILADFDGDGAKDLFLLQNNDVSGLLTTDVHVGGISLIDSGIFSLGWVGIFFNFSAGDFNGDGFMDLVAYEDIGSIIAPYSAARFLYGFRPLKNPTITAPGETSNSLRVTVSLSVDGNPSEMFFSGDVTPEFKDKWIPFRTSQELVLTPGGGTKTVKVRFRNAVGRESETVETSVAVHVEDTQVITETNHLRPGGTVSFACHLLNAGSLRARVYGRQGHEVIELENRQAESGIYPIQWDGRNAHGNLVARGVYFLVIEADGERTKKEILVE